MVFLLICPVALIYCGSPTAPTSTTASSGGLVTVSIDDGWKSTYQNAIPMLDAKGFKSTNYIITGRFTNPEYMNQNDVLSLQTRGHEVGAHTRSHQDLTLMSGAQLDSEILGSKSDLIGIGIRAVPSFAYPFGSYNNAVLDAVRRAGFESARATIDGYNVPGSDKLLLKRKNLGGNITAQDAKNWIDTAISTRTWLIFMVHHVDSTVSDFSVTPQLFQEVVNYLDEKKVRVVTVTQGLQMTP